jgi:tetratricopeptide (TPR) repeat protein
MRIFALNSSLRSFTDRVVINIELLDSRIQTIAEPKVRRGPGGIPLSAPRRVNVRQEAKKAFIYLLIIVTLTCCDTRETRLQRFLIQGNEQAQKQNFEQARKYFREALKLDSCFSDAWNNLGTISYRQGNFQEAWENYTHAIQCSTTFYPAYLNRANALYELNKTEEGLSDLLVYEKNSPDTFVVDFSRGLLLTKQKKYGEAQVSFQEALKKSKGNVEILINIGTVHYYQRELDSATFYLNKALLTDEDEPNIFNTLALIELERGNHAKALGHINQALRVKPNNSFFLNNRGYIRLLSGDAEGAIQDIDASISEDPYNAWAYRNKGLFYYKRYDIKNATRLLTRAKELDPTIDSLFVYLARTTSTIDKEASCNYYRQARSLKQVSDREFLKFCKQ